MSDRPRPVWEQQRAEWEQLAEQVTCPLCGATDGQSCTYAAAVRSNDESYRFLRWERFPRSAHQARIAVATDYKAYGYALREMERTCICGRDNLMAGRHPSVACRWHVVNVGGVPG